MEAVLRALADESRRTMLETLTRGPATAGELAAMLPIARPGVSRHLRVLREAGLVEVRQEAQRRVYSLRPQPLAEVDEWLGRYRALWEQRLDALHTEIARGKHERLGAPDDQHRTHPGQNPATAKRAGTSSCPPTKTWPPKSARRLELEGLS
jgi:DNA-binding transcriptional ArsR family regulator